MTAEDRRQHRHENPGPDDDGLIPAGIAPALPILADLFRFEPAEIEPEQTCTRRYMTDAEFADRVAQYERAGRSHAAAVRLTMDEDR